MNSIQWAFTKAYFKKAGNETRKNGMEIGKMIKSVLARITA